MARAQIEIDLSAIAANVRKVINETKVDVCAVVKADAYGHGLVSIAQVATDAGAKWLGVALLEEAITLRTHGLSIPIIAWLTPLTEDFDSALRHDIDLGVSSIALLEKVMAAGERTGITPRIHVEVDTGMTRGGVLNEWPVFLKKVSAATLSEKVELVGFFSHFARADEPQELANEMQLKKFTNLLSELKATGVTPKYLHFANSAAALSNPNATFDFVRLGIAMYGLSPDVKTMGSSKELGLIPAMTLRAKLHLVKQVPAGAAVGYGGSAITTVETKVGVVAMGYADGIPRNADNSTGVFFDGERAPIIGRVSMDQFVVDLGVNSKAITGDEVIVFGAGNVGEYTADDWASASGTINYEIVTRIASRVPRIHNR